MSSVVARTMIHADVLPVSPFHTDARLQDHLLQTMRPTGGKYAGGAAHVTRVSLNCRSEDKLAGLLAACLKDVTESDDWVDFCVRTMSSYQLRTNCQNISVASLRTPKVLMSLIRRLQQPDQDGDGDWEHDVVDAVAPMNPILRSDLMKILKGVTRSFPDKHAFESFIQLRVHESGYQAACSQKQIVRLFVAQSQLFGSLKHLTNDLIQKIQSYMCIAPADTLNYLIRHCLLHEETVPVIVRLVSEELRVVAMARADGWEESLLVSIISQALFFGPGSEVPDKIVKLLTLIQEASPNDPVVNTEDLLIDWTGGVRDVHDMSRLTRAVILLMERESENTTEAWNRIDVVQLCKLFVDCLLDVGWDSVTKHRFLKVMRLILKSRVQRKLTASQVDQLSQMYSSVTNRLIFCYLQPFTDVDLMEHIELFELETSECLLIVSMTERSDLSAILPRPGYPHKELAGILPFLTPIEFGRLYTYLIHFFNPTQIICLSLRTISSMSKDPQVTITELTTALQSFDYVFREFYECGKNLIMLNCSEWKRDLNSEKDSGSFEEAGYDSDSDSHSIPLIVRQEPLYTKQSYPNQEQWTAYSLFHVLHLMLRLQIRFYGTPCHEILKSMIDYLIYTTSHANGDWSQDIVPLTARYRLKRKLWFELEPYQREYLIEHDANLK